MAVTAPLAPMVADAYFHSPECSFRLPTKSAVHETIRLSTQWLLEQVKSIFCVFAIPARHII